MTLKRILPVAAAFLWITFGVGPSGGATDLVAGVSTSPCDSSVTHGAYTGALCPGDVLEPSEYIFNGDYRFYFNAIGQAYVWNEEEQEVSCMLWPYGTTEEDPDEMVYSEYNGNGYFQLLAYNILDELDYVIPAGPTQEDGNWVELTSDGHLRFIDRDGARVRVDHFYGCW